MRRTIILLLALLLMCGSAIAEEESFFVHHGSREEMRVAITVDDCYHWEQVQEIVELCEEYSVPVTFFVIGKALKYADTEVWRGALAAGCEIGNHSWNHGYMNKMDATRAAGEMSRTQHKLDEVLGYHYPMQQMRPPMGKLAQKAVPGIQREGYCHAVLWDVSQTDPEKALQAVQPGSILLYHAREKDIKCLRTLIPALLEAGYTCDTVSGLLGNPPVATGTDIPE